MQLRMVRGYRVSATKAVNLGSLPGRIKPL